MSARVIHSSSTTRETLVIDERYSGFPGVALGGYAAGLLARAIGPSAEVRFRRPVPVGVPLDLVVGATAVLARDGVVLAEGAAAAVDVGTLPAVSLAAANEADRHPLGRERHLFPQCFCCGVARAEGEGLRVLVGPTGGGVVAGTWTAPREFADRAGAVPSEIAWAAVDCPGIWALVVAAPPDTAERVVTGTLAVAIARPLRAGARYVVAAWPLGRVGRRLYAGTALLDERGAVAVVARQTCVVTDAGVPLALRNWTAPAS